MILGIMKGGEQIAPQQTKATIILVFLYYGFHCQEFSYKGCQDVGLFASFGNSLGTQKIFVYYSISFFSLLLSLGSL